MAQYEAFPENNLRPTVSLVRGENRRKNVHDALEAVDDGIRPVLKTKKYVIIKPNIVAARAKNALSATNPDELHGILDYLAPRFKGPIAIAESSAGDTQQNYDVLEYAKVVEEHRDQKVTLVDLNREAKIKVLPLIDYHIHVVPIRLAAQLFDPDAYVICAAILKTHNVAVATLSVKNMVLGAPLHWKPGDSAHWDDKRKMHAGIRQTNYLMYLVAASMKPYWGATVIDGFEGMEGNGPGTGNAGAAPHRHRFHGLRGGGPRGRGNHGHRRRLSRLRELSRGLRRGPVGLGQDQRQRRVHRFGAEEIPTAPRHRAGVAVAGAHARPASEYRVDHADRPQ